MVESAGAMSSFVILEVLRIFMVEGAREPRSRTKPDHPRVRGSTPPGPFTNVKEHLSKMDNYSWDE
eukprot:12900811-Prorocentrum_lima.AAC.1